MYGYFGNPEHSRACRCGLPAGRLAQLAATAAELEREAARWQQLSQACSTLFLGPLAQASATEGHT